MTIYPYIFCRLKYGRCLLTHFYTFCHTHTHTYNREEIKRKSFNALLSHALSITFNQKQNWGKIKQQIDYNK